MPADMHHTGSQKRRPVLLPEKLGNSQKGDAFIPAFEPLSLAVVFWFCSALPCAALEFEIDYRYDTQSFFSAEGNPGGAEGAAQARAALEAAAARWGAVINQSLLAVNEVDHAIYDVRIGFDHPGTGAFYEVSSARNSANDFFVDIYGEPPADEYRNGIQIPADTMVIYAGGRDLGDFAGFGGSSYGINWTNQTINNPSSILNRGFNVGGDSLPVWGGSISFDNATTDWHFDHTTVPVGDKYDFYTTALHEIGHILGLSTGWDDWLDLVSGGAFTGSAAIADFNADNHVNVASLALEPNGRHWLFGEQDSLIFPYGNPNYLGTVGPRNLQNLALEPKREVELLYRRYELTNVDVAAAKDVGWGVIDPPVFVKADIALDESGVTTVSWKSEPGISYQIETSINLAAWNKVTPPVPSEGTFTDWEDGEAGYSDPSPLATSVVRKFYRVSKN